MTNEYIISKLLKVKQESPTSSPTSSVENIIIELIRSDDTSAAVALAKKIRPSSTFAVIFAEELLAREDYSYFLEIQGISGKPITIEQADTVLMSYVGDGKNSKFLRSVPNEILEGSSRAVMMLFFEFALQDKGVGSFDYAKIFWGYLKKKI
ncbi:MAG: hypothetical protein WCX30_03020 [Candidatus Paceibacterota bacterium]|jgi:hypothetical protein|nr:hypothetical protein [bacterium]